MQIIGIYSKEYECSKCKAKINYGGASVDGKEAITKDGQPFNKVFGKGSNKISVAVDAGTKTQHGCFAAMVKKDYEAATGVIQVERPVVNGMPDVSKGNLTSRTDYTAEFLEEWNNIYVRAQPLIAKHCGEGASVKDKHIATCGLIHDYFNSKN
tara:strand:- start:2402 stop:2863 length:462 start_codon:yes stop_codon:yes gene_type:complete